jgi:hypothetical protein
MVLLLYFVVMISMLSKVDLDKCGKSMMLWEVDLDK